MPVSEGWLLPPLAPHAPAAKVQWKVYGSAMRFFHLLAVMRVSVHGGVKGGKL